MSLGTTKITSPAQSQVAEYAVPTTMHCMVCHCSGSSAAAGSVQFDAACVNVLSEEGNVPARASNRLVMLVMLMGLHDKYVIWYR